MKISVITPSFNQQQFLSLTLSSIEEQVACDFEHIIIDPGSTDGSIDLISTYTAKNSWARSIIGVDKSQTNAINIGFEKATGEVLCWLNSDDRYTHSRVLEKVCAEFDNHADLDVLYCNGYFVDASGNKLKNAYVHRDSSTLPHAFLNSIGILQPAVFIRRRAFEKAGLLDENMHFSFDYEYWIRLLRAGCKFMHLCDFVASAIVHDDAKTMRSRGTSLQECIEVTKRYFGFAPYEWVQRLVDCTTTGADGILVSSNISDVEFTKNIYETFVKYNNSQESIAKLFSYAEYPECEKSLSAIERQVQCGLWIVTAFDAPYFSTGMTLLSGLCEQGYPDTPKLVFDLGLTASQRAAIFAVEHAYVVDFNKEHHKTPDWFMKPKSYVYKLLAMEHVRSIAKDNDVVLWIDAGVYPTHNLSNIENLILANGSFFVDHDDRASWPFYNITFTSDECCHSLETNLKELLSPHICSCLMGFKKNHYREQIFQHAYRAALDPLASLGDKHPEAPIKRNSIHKTEMEAERQRLLNQPGSSWDIPHLRDIFGYLGHRQDQSILSVMAARYGAETYSAKMYCVGSDESSRASKLNWNCGSFSTDVTAELNAFSRYPQSLTIHHRGTIVSFEHLRFSGHRQTEAIILGNGPSLRDFDFSRLARFDVFGMNAAYRFWHENQWYPQYYSCLDLVVGNSHKNEIENLIARSEELGIVAFLLRDALIKELGPLGLSSKIFNFDLLRVGYLGWQAEPVTTGSHTCAWAAILGYRDIYLLGIDCNYVEVISNAERRDGTVLEIVENGNNPNYFFDGYQKVGDKYNVPNPSKDLHIRSWQNVSKGIRAARVINANLNSKIDAFPFITFDDLEQGGQVRLWTQSEILEKKAALEPSQFINVPSCADIEKTTVDQGFVFPTIGPYDRSSHAHWDETNAVAQLFSESLRGKIMIDVGAHIGSALAPFLDRGWKIFAFEPDENNRSKLLQRLDKHKNKALVTLDTRCVSNQSQNDVSFYRSEQSTGISGLSAFHESHVEAQKVDTISLTDFFQDQQLPEIDFLKVDTEGYDFFVLQGYPWERNVPAVIECEFEDAKTIPLGYTFHDLASYLVEKGYTVYVSEWHPIIRYGIRHDWNRLLRYPCDLADPKAWGNILAFRDPINEYQILSAVQKVLSVNRSVSQLESNKTASPFIPPAKVAKKETDKSNSKPSNFLMNTLSNLSVFSSYAHFAEWLRDDYPVLFQIGKISMRCFRFLKRNLLVTILILAVVSGLLVAPLLANSLAGYAIHSWIVAVLSVLGISAIGVAWLIRSRIRLVVAGEHAARQSLRADLLRELRKSIGQLSNQQEKSSSDLAQFACKLDQQNLALAQQAELSEKLESAINQLLTKQEHLATNQAFNVGDYQPFNRRLTTEHSDVLVKDWAEKLGLKISHRSIAYLAHRICTLEQLSKGRLATPIENAVLRVLVASAVKNKDLKVLEIGTLFGLGLTAVYDYCVSRFDSVSLTAIDPLDGYYGTNIRDIITDEAISEQTFRANLAIAGVSEEEYTLIKTLSTDASTIASIPKGFYDVLVIDGDHSYEVVKADYVNYMACVKTGGYIIFDDYGSPEWPGVQQFVDEEVLNSPDLVLVGVVWRSAVFQVIK